MGLTLVTGRANTGKTGVVFWGTQQNNAPFLGGTLCVKLPITRLSLVTLDANGAGTDLAAPLDADGSTGSSASDGDGGVPNPSNDLVLQNGRVGCTTCHAPHNADSNSLTVDVR